jgi:hypothetical protein
VELDGRHRRFLIRQRDERARAEAVVAWRFWDLDASGDQLLLRSPFRSSTWPLREPLHAECLGLNLPGRRSGRRHDAPGDECRCGVYGATYRELRAFLRTSLVRPSSLPVLGRVQLWGRLVGNEFGWRAEWAYPEQLLVSTLSDNAFAIAEALEAYDVRVSVLDARETFSTLNPETRLRAVR